MKMKTEENIRSGAVLDVAKRMAIAARTAPKGRGKDFLTVTIVDEAGIKEISDWMKKMARRKNVPGYFRRDAANILSAQAMVLLGTTIESMGLDPCGMCGWGNCAEKKKHPDHPCVFNPGDLGIAVGSAVSVAMDARVDNRIMYTVGQAVLEMGLMGDDVRIVYGIPLSVSAKNPFFDREKRKKPERARRKGS